MKKTNSFNPRIMGIVGSMGAGKTLFMSALSYQYQKTHHIYANYDLHTRDYNITPDIVPDMMEQANNLLGKKLVLLDEVHIFVDSRSAMTLENQLFSYFITQTRKNDIQLLYTTQQFSQVDVRLRENTDLLAFPMYDQNTDQLIVYFYNRHFLTGKFQYAMMKTYKNISPIFDTYTTEQLMGERMTSRLKQKIRNKEEDEEID